MHSVRRGTIPAGRAHSPVHTSHWRNACFGRRPVLIQKRHRLRLLRCNRAGDNALPPARIGIQRRGSHQWGRCGRLRSSPGIRCMTLHETARRPGCTRRAGKLSSRRAFSFGFGPTHPAPGRNLSTTCKLRARTRTPHPCGASWGTPSSTARWPPRRRRMG